MNKQFGGRKIVSNQMYAGPPPQEPKVYVPDEMNISQCISPINYDQTNQFFPQTSTPKLHSNYVSSNTQNDVSFSPLFNKNVQNVALQYGQQLTNTGANYFKNEIEKIIPTTSLKYYFAVDTNYVVKKLSTISFPFLHSDWSIKFEQQNPVQPRYEINAPDLYIPLMSFFTYVLVAGLVMGTQQRFSPELLGFLSSKVVAWWLIEILVYTIALYIMNLQTTLKTYDLIAYSGYKFVGVIVSILSGLFFARLGYYLTLAYCGFALVFFLLRSLKGKVLSSSQSTQNQFFESSFGTKRRRYFLLFFALFQPIFQWWFSFEFV